MTTGLFPIAPVADGAFPDELFTIHGDPASIMGAARLFTGYATVSAEVLDQLAVARVESWLGSDGDLYRARLAEHLAMMKTATTVFSRLAAELRSFADLMATQQAAMRSLRAEAWALWQQLRSAPQGGPQQATTGIRSAWEDCRRRARVIHDTMDRAQATATGRISALQGPPPAPTPASGAGRTPGAQTSTAESPSSDALEQALKLTGTPMGMGPENDIVRRLLDEARSFSTDAAGGTWDKLTDPKEWVKGLNVVPNEDVPEAASYLMPGLAFWATTGGLATDYDEFRKDLRFMKDVPAKELGSGSTAVNKNRVKLDRFINRSASRLSRLARATGDAVDSMAWAASQPAVALWAAAGGPALPSPADLSREATALKNRTGPALARAVGEGKSTITGVIGNLANKPVNPAWSKIGKAAGPIGVGVTVFTSGMEQWQKDNANPSIHVGEKVARAGVRGGLVAGGSLAGEALGGAAAGAAFGTLIPIPVVGTAVGGVVGGIAGGIAGSMAGDAVADAVMDRWDQWRR